ncbi:HNH endonuclease signature motif containing protein [Corynebacterium hadale]
MTVLTDFIAIDRSGMHILAAAVGKPVDELVAMGMPRDRARQVHAAASVLCAKTSHSKYQQRAQAGARANGHRVETLSYITRAAQSIRETTVRWSFIETLCNTAGDLAWIRRRAAELKKELVPAVPRSVRASVKHHGDGMATLRVTGSALAVQGVYDAAKDDVAGWLANDCPKADYTVRVTANLDLGEYVKIVSGAGDDVEVRFDNGVVVSGAEFVRMRLAELGSVILVGAADGPVNAYDVRFAHRKHREMMLADSLTCTWKDCDVPASQCDAHHMVEHQHGGETEVGNLGWLCRYHNYQAGRPSRGRTQRRDGRIVWVSPSGRVTPTGADHAARAPFRSPDPPDDG